MSIWHAPFFVESQGTMNANQRVILRPSQERFDLSSKELCAFWDTVHLEYSQRTIREQSIQLLDNDPIRAIFDREDQ